MLALASFHSPMPDIDNFRRRPSSYMEGSPQQQAPAPTLTEQAIEMALAGGADRAPVPDAPGKMSKAALLAMVLGDAADLGSTAYALKQPGLEEGNWMGNNIGAIAATKAGGALLKWLLMKKLEKDHPKIANGIGYGSGAAMGAVAAHNVALANTYKQR